MAEEELAAVSHVPVPECSIIVGQRRHPKPSLEMIVRRSEIIIVKVSTYMLLGLVKDATSNYWIAHHPL